MKCPNCHSTGNFLDDDGALSPCDRCEGTGELQMRSKSEIELYLHDCRQARDLARCHRDEADSSASIASHSLEHETQAAKVNALLWVLNEFPEPTKT